MTSPAPDIRRIPARGLLLPAELALLRQRSEWRSVALIAHAWTVILGSIALVAIFPNPVTWVLAVMLIGSRQLGLAILMHDGAHGCLSANSARNMALS
jgi:fatty acid desaturase